MPLIYQPTLERVSHPQIGGLFNSAIDLKQWIARGFLITGGGGGVTGLGVTFFDVGGGNAALSSTGMSFVQEVSAPLTNGYILVGIRLATQTTSGDNITATLNGTGLTPIPVSGGGASGISYNTNRSLHVRGMPVGNLGAGTYNIVVRGSGIIGSPNCLVASALFNNVNQTVPTGALVTSGTTSASITRTAYPLTDVGDMAVGIYGQVNSTGVSGVGVGNVLVFNSGSANILGISYASGTSPSTYLQFWASGSANGALLGVPLKKA